MNELLESGAHYGHRKNFWNPKMAKYVYGVRNGIHIIDLGQTAPLLKRALKTVKELATKNGRVLFVGTKKQASEVISSEAIRCGQYYVNHRWLGGMLTNWDTVSASLKKLSKYESILANEEISLTKKEKLDLDRKRIKLNNVLGGIRNMGGRPDMLFVIDTKIENLAITEARKLNIPVVAIVDTNSDPDGINYIIPGNDDARKAIELYTRLIADAVLEGMQENLAKSGIDMGAMEVVELEKNSNSSQNTASLDAPKAANDDANNSKNTSSSTKENAKTE